MDLHARGLNANVEQIKIAFYLKNSIIVAFAQLGSITNMVFVWRALQVIKRE